MGIYTDTGNAIQYYLSSSITAKGIYTALINPHRPSVTRVEVIVSEADNTHMNGKDLYIDIDINMPALIDGMALSLQIVNSNEIPIIYTYSFDGSGPILRKIGHNRMRCILPKCKLYANSYYLIVHLSETKGRVKFDEISKICAFEVKMPNKIIEWGWQKDVCVYTEDFVWKEIN